MNSPIPFYDIDTGKWQGCRIMQKVVKMNGTSESFEFPVKLGFTSGDTYSVILAGADTTTALQFRTTGRNSFKVTASASVTNLKIKVLLIGY